MKFGGDAAQLDCIVRQLFLTPAVGDSLQHADERDGRGHQNLAGERALQKFGIVLQRGAQKMIAGQEQHHHFGRGLEFLPVFAAAQLDRVAHHLLRVALECGAAGRVVGR